MKTTMGKWKLSFLLSLPVLIFLLCYFFNHSQSVIPTGFVQYDNVSYTGNARQYLYKDHHGLFYSNRLNDSNQYSSIYFQPQHLVLALLMKAGLAPGMALCLFNYLFTIIFFRILIALYDHLFPALKYRKLMLLLFAWGGGVLTFSGWLLYILNSTQGRNFIDSGVFLDPASGWWGLNLGRSLLFSMEVYYHALFFGIVLLMVKKKWTGAFLISVLLCLSHPFTGIELLLIAIVWILVEKLGYRNQSVPWYFISAMLLLIFFHLWYYLMFLNRYPEHQSVFTQYRLNWRLRFFQFIPAYILVGVATFFSIKKAASLQRFLSFENNRLLAGWAIVALLMANHELFITPVQPLHFTRGYIWSALFLSGTPALNDLLFRINQMVRGKLLLFPLVCLFLSDNIYWFTLNNRYTLSENSVMYISREQEEILQYLSATTTSHTLIVSSDIILPYLSTVYSKAYSWISHRYNTPFYNKKRVVFNNFIKTGKLPAAWRQREVLFIANKNNQEEIRRYSSTQGMKILMETDHYRLYHLSPDSFQPKKIPG